MSSKLERPCVKPEHRPIQVSGGRIRIGGTVYGVASEIEDSTGSVWTLLNAMDGTRSVDEVASVVAEAHPGERREGVLAAVTVLTESGHIYDAAGTDPPILTDRDKERHDRSRLFYRWIDPKPRVSWWEPQAWLRQAKVTLVGVGGTGGNAALALAASGVGELRCVDSDVVELSNLNRQVLYTERDIGRPKVEAAAERLHQLNSDIVITCVRHTITGIGDLQDLSAECDLLMLCADRPGEIRAWANRACLATNTPWVDAGYHGPVITVAAYIPGNGACYECVWRAEYERHRAMGVEADYSVERNSQEAVTAPTAGLSGYLAAHLGISLLTGVVPVRSGLVQGISLLSPDHHYVIEPVQRLDCPACQGSTS
ncbi:HesA/MoeB/ThiF family protein [Rhizomonospora bruguierae]|uniref:HesA/MoeB/ThiF family protein n=1 Tax=Rhizomonospora bruguierae TaxID=1581705 RepID=UPI001BCDA8E1|nr:ThiF family adenylyltransferase [Micromonospora sp. NBRC 107566]